MRQYDVRSILALAANDAIRHRVMRALAALAGAGFATAGTLPAQGVRYHATPSAYHIEWDDKLGLRNTTMLGGRVGATFGQLLGLEAYYYTRNGVRTRFSATGLTTLGGVALTDQDLELQHFGADLRLQIGTGKLSPFLYGGAGVLRFEPESGLRTDQIVIKYGGGIRFALAPGVEAQMFAENARFRLDRFRLAPGAASTFPVDPDATERRDNLAFGVGLGIGLGASKSGNAYERWSVASIPIEPFVGRLEFDESALGHQWFLGVRSGIDVGSYLGLRAFYMQGVDDRFDETAPIKSYGGEAQFNFNANRGPAPFLVVGAGRIKFDDEFRDANALPREDRTTLILGGGLGIRLTDRFRLNAAARDFIYTNDDLDDVSSTSELRHNLMLSAGVTFAIGRGRSPINEGADRDRERETERDMDRARDRVTRPDWVDARCDDLPRGDDRDECEARRREHRDRCDRMNKRLRGDDDRERVEQDDHGWDDDHRGDRRMRCPRSETIRGRKDRSMDARSGETERFVSDREATFPVPAEGEIYIRYGKPVDTRRPGASAGDSVVAGPERSRAAARPDSVGPEARVDRVDLLPTQRQRDDSIRIASLVRDSVRAAVQLARDSVRAAVPPAEVEGPVREVAASPDRTEEPRGTMVFGMNARNPEVYAGLNLDSPTQFVVGALIDLRRPGSGGVFSFVPEVALGVGDGGTSLLLAGNVAVRLPTLDIGNSTTMTPRARLGAGILTYSGSVGDRRSTQGVLNFAYGLSTNAFRVRGLGRPQVFFEHQGIDLFDLNRLVVGFQWR